MKSTYLKKLNLPDTPGVYTFRDNKKRPLYIGRATSLRDRVKSYFANDLIETRGPRIVDMVTRAKAVTFEEMKSVLEAIIRESLLIKRYQPQYNVDLRDDKSALHVIITKEEWPRVFTLGARDLEKKQADKTIDFEIAKTFGPFDDSGLVKEVLKILRRLFPFRDKKATDQRHELFYRTINRSPEITGENAHENYLRNIEYLILFFEGKNRELKKKISEDMDRAARELKFEEASEYKRLLYALDHIRDVSLIKKDKGSVANKYRIEAYDIAHLSGKNVVGVMVVSVNESFAKEEYRKFKIGVDANNDVGNLAEVLKRRLNHPEWQFPDLIVVDGGEAQKNVAEKILSVGRINIPVIAVTKDERHKASVIVGNPDLIKKYRQEIVAINVEAHRFAIGYHRRLARENLFGK